jgi:DNA-binding LytR/AlgR family response regulator
MHDKKTDRFAVTAIIADDEPVLRFHLRQALADVWPGLDVVAMAGDGPQALVAIQEWQPNVVFLDIRMPELDGLQVACELASMAKEPLVVFITAYDQYAVAAFERNAVDYLLKPVKDQRLFETCNKLQQRLMSKTQSSSPTPDLQLLLQQMQQFSKATKPLYLNWIKASKGEEIHVLAAADVLYFKAGDKYISVYINNAQGQLEEYLLRCSLKELLQQLDPQQFWQVHRSTVVNVASIEKVSKDLAGKMSVFIGAIKLPVSRAMQAQFKTLN